MKTPLVLLPGLMCDAGLWQPMLPQLQAIGPLTFGDLSQDESVAAMASRVLADSPPGFTLIGFSMGGFVAREIARRAPQRVSRLVLIATSSAPDSEQQSRMKAAVADSLRHASGRFHGLASRAIELSLSARHAADPTLKQQILDMSLRVGRDAYIRQLEMRRDGDTHLLGELHCPTLIVAAADDRMRSQQEARALCAGISGARLVTIADSGHMLPLEQPERLAALLTDWIASTPQPG